MNQVKVKQTELYKDSQSEHIVVKGKLVLIPMKETTIGERTKDYILIEGIHDIYCWYKPIIISKKEEIEVGDTRFDNEYKSIGSCVNEEEKKYYNSSNRFYKILALPEHFSPKHLQAIIDGKLKDSDEVFVECEPISTNVMMHNFKNTTIKLCNNYIKLFPIKSEESWENLYEKFKQTDEYKKLLPLTYSIGLKYLEWLKENYNPPIKK